MAVSIRALLVVVLIGFLSGCATQPEEIPPTYVSPLKYKDYNCSQIAEEMDYVSHETSDLYLSLKKKADNDEAQMGVGMILFWPLLFTLEGGDGPEARQYADLRGEYEALRKASVKKECSKEMLPPSPKEVIEQKKKEEEAREQEVNEEV